MSAINIIAILYPKEGKSERVKELLTNLTQDVHKKETNTLRYVLTEELGSKNPSIIMIETYKDKNAQIEHAKTDHFKTLVTALQKEDLQAKPMFLVRTASKAGFELDRKLFGSKL